MNEQISEFMDGEVDEAESKRLIAILQHSEAKHEWHAYHLIGDELRGTSSVSRDFMDRFSARLADEPTVLAPARFARPRTRTFALSAAASVAAVGFVVWAVMQSGSENTNPVMLAANAPLSGLSSVNVNPYLLAHQEYSHSVALQGENPYVRTVAEVREAAAR
ncbi:MAG: sigma-E factor negative regulatory protein [Sulfuricella denitrificans]|nr:sigma-E factor negative regulatory protein [Sulfuricella denitrificans]